MMMHVARAALGRAVLAGTARRFVHAEARLAAKSLRLPAVTPAKGADWQPGTTATRAAHAVSFCAGNYVSAVRTGNLIFLSGHLPYDEGGALITGKVRRVTAVQRRLAHVRTGRSWAGT